MNLLSVMCFALIGLLFASAVTFGGYRLFMILLPIWGFIFGFGFGAQTMQALFGVGFLATATSWVVGLIVAVAFAILSYVFWFFAVALFSASVGYGLAMSFMSWLTPGLGFINWIVAVVVGVALAFVVLRFNIQKIAIIVLSAMAGAGAMILVLLSATGNIPPDQLVANPIKEVISSSVWWFIFFAGMAIAGIVVQMQTTRNLEIEEYNRMTGVYAE